MPRLLPPAPDLPILLSQLASKPRICRNLFVPLIVTPYKYFPSPFLRQPVLLFLQGTNGDGPEVRHSFFLKIEENECQPPHLPFFQEFLSEKPFIRRVIRLVRFFLRKRMLAEARLCRSSRTILFKLPARAGLYRMMCEVQNRMLEPFRSPPPECRRLVGAHGPCALTSVGGWGGAFVPPLFLRNEYLFPHIPVPQSRV